MNKNKKEKQSLRESSAVSIQELKEMLVLGKKITHRLETVNSQNLQLTEEDEGLKSEDCEDNRIAFKNMNEE